VKPPFIIEKTLPCLGWLDCWLRHSNDFGFRFSLLVWLMAPFIFVSYRNYHSMIKSKKHPRVFAFLFSVRIT
jgi:hypothetical protein